MNKFLTVAVAACAIAAATTDAQAGGFKFGPKVGVNVNKFSLSSDALSSDNRCGFTGGVGAQFTVPLIGVGADVSVMYSRRSAQNEIPVLDTNGTITGHEVINANYDYISVPVHLMYKLDLPAINKIVAPYVVTGPDFAFRVSKEILDDYKAKKYNVSWDFGIGVELISHLQVSATYSLGMNKAMQYVGVANGAAIKGNTNGWTITAAWMF